MSHYHTNDEGIHSQDDDSVGTTAGTDMEC